MYPSDQHNAATQSGQHSADQHSADAASKTADSDQVSLGGGNRAISKACDAASPGYLDTITTRTPVIWTRSRRIGVDRISYLGTHTAYLGAYTRRCSLLRGSNVLDSKSIPTG